MNKKRNELTEIREFRLKLYPKNFDLVRHFYETIMDWPVTKEWNRGENDKGVMFDTGGATIELLSPEKKYQPIVGCDLSLEVSDVWELFKKFQNSDTVIYGIRDNVWGDTSFKIADPEGFEITFFTKT
ncbi:MAG: hypothetical protein A2821_01165 [Candidatus Magasanikbacteria bacterium RIFCSPHIGHO2_01_FULL_41_23]|uniref:VOC domain-containing protein n=1 Tax=Candidatus Magasanikbacteria bacterium RIFCSPLOWO2_01_FULL_40_15 TaxID=1798686 RepID=A0A1F6N499_9BACT|nr:MAG: hypothetical protein A2821_01165 [Candidatus Magasanikbacteria bacterium RIFCSPHIGHO2_01_FULL_41_23]OGH66737.1 MAG: hypothetical protein A3C66_01470 [Candidatus Magasanikbacteria bacterium RIFCSPHIGHO2_02_FULL_41_35]OGH74537.1 MAG: hypothetical protein A3F22_02875 [Candidatus Magasanikbacteria bacterium RIFCSPHIGHO2_12_FULL_41_16]OGH78826.1 MAG: hypothetical protein A2983_00625 [Candidatus Magasanikbacteria bacterium RIFCSPLOWO2_01_FULL_40_15]